jgi:microcystin-dependent protein
MDQTNLAQNGIYFFNGTGLERTLDANSLLKIQAAKVQVQEGTFEKRAFYLVVSDFQGIIENEPIKAVEIFSPLTENQVLLSNLNKLPTNTIIGNKENIIETPTALTVLEVREMLGIENVDNTSDLNKPISTATQVALDLKTNQTDFEDLNTYVATETQNLLTAIETKQNNLPIGGERDYLGYSGNELVVKTFSQGTVGLENVDNTSDLNKPISIAQQEEFDKYPKPRGLLLVNDLNLTFDFLDGTYIVNNSTSTINLPTEVEATSSIVLFLQKNFLSNQYNSLNQTLFEKTTTGKNYLYTRNGNVANATFSNWVRLATKEEIDNVNTRVDNILNLTFAGEVYLIPEVDALLAEKESAILPGTSNQYYRGDKVFASLQTDAVIEGQNNFYFSEPRVRASKLTGYQENSATKTLATDNILQAFGKKADLNSPNFTGTATAPTVATNDNSNKLATSTLINLKLNEMLTGEVKAIARQNFNDFTTDGGTGIWLYCNGRAFSVTTYPKLFAVCGYTYGGSGTSFNIPDLRNLVIACASTTEPINKKEGEKKHLITENEMPEHRHSKPDNLTNYIGSGSYGGSAGNSVSGGFASSQFTGKAGGNQPHNNMQPTIYLPYFIYAV